MLGQAALRPAETVSAKRWPLSGDGLWLTGISAATCVYLLLLATDAVDGLRGNAQWHIPYVAHPSDGAWWLPLVPGFIIAALPLVSLPTWATLTAGMATMCAFVYTLFAAEWGGGDNLMAKVINEPTAFHRAAGNITDLRSVLANYPQYLATFEPSSHMPSHPPGDMLLFRWLNDLMQANPGLREATLGWGRTFISGTDMLLSTGNAPYLMAGAIAAIPLVIGLGRLTAVPLAWLAAIVEAPVVPSTMLVLVLPTLLVHVPLLDTVYPLLTALVLGSGIMAVERRSWPWAAASGLLLGLGLFFSASVIIIVVPLAIYGLLRRGWHTIRLAIAGFAGVALVWLALWVGWGINMPAIFQFLAKHQADWEARYTYWLWFRWKWYDFAMFCGIPVAALTVKFLAESVSRWRAGAATKLDHLFAGWLAMMAYLWLSTTTMAEVGRLWAPLMCFAVLFAARALPRSRGALSLVLLLELAQTVVINRYLEVINSG